MKKFSESEKESLVKGAQTAEASPTFDAFWDDVTKELLRLDDGALTISPKSST